MNKLIELVGQRFGLWTVLARSNNDSIGRAAWKCRCDCGAISEVRSSGLRSGRSTSCGCVRRAKVSWRCRTEQVTHGLSKTPTGKSFYAMMRRCFNKQAHEYCDYGGRGITVCSFLRISPQSIVDVIGLRPDGMTIDREDTNGHYSCGGCDECVASRWPMNIRWATRSGQQRNKRNSLNISINGKTKHLQDWAKEYGLNASMIQKRMAKGKSGAALFAKPNRGKR